MPCAPIALRAAAMLPSSSPRCTPSASTSAASAGSSLTTNSAPRALTARANAAACSRRVAVSALLLRYWIAVAPPAIAASTRATRSAVSAKSGVTA